MGRPESLHVQQVRAQLELRIREGYYRPGGRLLSARQIAQYYQVSYQTAHRLLRQLADTGQIERRQGAGTFLTGSDDRPRSVVLVLNARHKRKGSFGERLVEVLCEKLTGASIAFSFKSPGRFRPDVAHYPVFWEAPQAVALMHGQRHYGLILNDKPIPGLASMYLDSLSLDDYSGGVCAGEVLQQRFGVVSAAILGGPASDQRSQNRIRGFQSIFPGATPIHAKSWDRGAGLEPAARLLNHPVQGIFCANDRLAQAVIATARKTGQALPALMGFDNAPIAQHLGLNTIAIPWMELAVESVRMIQNRLAGSTAASSHQLLMPRPVIRTLPSLQGSAGATGLVRG